jgi:hypothetical protein
VITAVAVLLVVVLVVVLSQAVATVADAPVTAVVWATVREPRARAPPPQGYWRCWTRPKAPCPIRPHPVPFPELQADGRVHDRMLDPNHRPDYEENEGATTLRDREFS